LNSLLVDTEMWKVYMLAMPALQCDVILHMVIALKS